MNDTSLDLTGARSRRHASESYAAALACDPTVRRLRSLLDQEASVEVSAADLRKIPDPYIFGLPRPLPWEVPYQILQAIRADVAERLPSGRIHLARRRHHRQTPR